MDSNAQQTGQLASGVKDTPEAAVAPKKPQGFQKGHPHYPVKRPSIRQQRKKQIEALGGMIAKMAAQFDSGEEVDPIAYATLLNSQRRLLAELY
jgi:hypothetical protein